MPYKAGRNVHEMLRPGGAFLIATIAAEFRDKYRCASIMPVFAAVLMAGAEAAR